MAEKIIAEADMPKSCCDCKMLTMISENVGCDKWKSDHNIHKLYIQRHPDCPLKIKTE